MRSTLTTHQVYFHVVKWKMPCEKKIVWISQGEEAALVDTTFHYLPPSTVYLLIYHLSIYLPTYHLPIIYS